MNGLINISSRLLGEVKHRWHARILQVVEVRHRREFAYSSSLVVEARSMMAIFHKSLVEMVSCKL